MHRPKIAVIGAGNVGATCAQRLAERDYADIVLVDVVQGLAAGKALDITEAGPLVGYDTLVLGSHTYDLIDGAGLVVVTAGAARKPGMSRDDLLFTNMRIVSSIAAEIRERAPGAIVVMVTNPLDVMAQLVMEVTEFPKERVVGMAGLLDAARFRTFIAAELGVSAKDVSALLLGGHGDAMVPLPSSTTVNGVPLTQLLAADRIEAFVTRTRNGGAEIVSLLGAGSAFYAPSAAVADMVDSVVLDQKRVLPCSAYLEGEYGIHGIFLGVPVQLGAAGIERIIEVELTSDERAQLENSAEDVRASVGRMREAGSA